MRDVLFDTEKTQNELKEINYEPRQIFIKSKKEDIVFEVPAIFVETAKRAITCSVRRQALNYNFSPNFFNRNIIVF